jgi:hypothetical protein
VAVGTSRGARTVVLKRVRPAGPRTSRRRNRLDDGERERESQRNPGKHGHSPRVEASSGFCGLDPGTRRLFPCSHSKGVRPGTSLRVLFECAVHVTVICSVQPNEWSDSIGDIPYLRPELGDAGPRRALRPMTSRCAMAIDVFREARVQPIGSSPSIRDSADMDRCHPIDLGLHVLVRLTRAMLAPWARLCSASTSITAL